MIVRRHAAGAAIALLSAMSPAWAQTPLGGQVPTRTLGSSTSGAVPTTPPGKAPAATPGQQQPQAPQAQPATARVPMSGASSLQALYQSEGEYTEMRRQGPGGQIQEAWDELSDRQGVYAVRLCAGCVYKVRTREFMITTIVLPEDAVIDSADLGDLVGFVAQVKAANMIAVRPTGYGFDTNMNVYTKSGAVYPFYLRSEGFNSKFVPDVKVTILGLEKTGPIEGWSAAAGDGPERREKQGEAPIVLAGGQKAAAMRDLVTPAAAAGDFVRNVPFDPAKLHGWKDYSLSGDSELKPEVVYRDDFFTYIRYGEKWDGLELFSAYVTIDGIDELVNTRVQGSTFIVESVAPLITLKSGKKFLCIRYDGEKS